MSGDDSERATGPGPDLSDLDLNLDEGAGLEPDDSPEADAEAGMSVDGPPPGEPGDAEIQFEVDESGVAR